MRPATTATPLTWRAAATRSSACDARQPALELRQLRLERPLLVEQLAQPLRRVGRRDLEDVADLAQHALAGATTDSTAAAPATASIRRTPDATAPSVSTLKRPIWPVASRWVPPQSSVEKSPMRHDAHAVAVLLAEQRHGARRQRVLEVHLARG